MGIFKHNEKPISSPSTPTVVMLNLSVVNGEGASVSLLTDLYGIFNAKETSPGRFQIDVTKGFATGASVQVIKDGYKVINHRLTNVAGVVMPIPTQGSWELMEEILTVDFKPLPRLTARSKTCFGLDTGELFTVVGVSDFNLLYQFIYDLDTFNAVLEDRTGCNMHRVFTRYSIDLIGSLTLQNTPDLYEHIVPFCNALAAKGRYVNFVAYTGHEDFDKDHWERLGIELQKVTNAIYSLVNEADQEGDKIDGIAINDMNFTPIPGVLCSHGSNGSQVTPPRPAWDWEELHTNGAPEEQRKPHNAMELSLGAEGLIASNKPAFVGETSRCPDNYPGDLDVAKQFSYDMMGCAVLLTGGLVFHSNSGKSSTPFSAFEKACFLEMIRASNDVPLRFQDGRYNNDVSAAVGNIIRSYQKILLTETFTFNVRAI